MKYCEFVGAGHIDMICDSIAENIVSHCLEHDSNSRVSIEVSAGQKYVYITGQISSNVVVPYSSIVEGCLRSAGLKKDYYNPTVIVDVEKQSENIAKRVSSYGLNVGFGDTNVAYGYAVNTFNFMPVEYNIASIVNLALLNYHYNNPNTITQDTKVMVVFDDEKGCIRNIFVSCQTFRDLSLDEEGAVYSALHNDILWSCLECDINDITIDFYTREENLSDSGTTGRKTAVNCYGLRGAMDGGALVGKDLTKGDRIGKFIARYVAVNIVGAKLSSEIEVMVECYMGNERPHITVKSKEGKHVDSILNLIVQKEFNDTLSYYIDKFKGDPEDFEDQHLYGYFGHNDECPWEHLDKVEDLKIYVCEGY